MAGAEEEDFYRFLAGLYLFEPKYTYQELKQTDAKEAEGLPL